jgi:hypothetical protein
MSPAPPPQSRGRIRPLLAVGDLVLAALWVCAGALVKLAVYGALGLGGRPEGDAVKIALSVLYMFVFAYLESATGGASYNPLTVLAATLASGGGPAVYLFTAFVRIPTQVMFLNSIFGICECRAPVLISTGLRSFNQWCTYTSEASSIIGCFVRFFLFAGLFWLC